MSARVRDLVRSAPLVALMIACGAAFAAPAPQGTTPPSAPAAAAATPAHPSRAHATSGSHAHAKPRRATATRTRATSAAPAPATNGAPRRLDEISIEGEVPVPQVLFITARDQRRLLDADPSRYVRTSRQVADATPAPTRVIVVGDTARAKPSGGAK